VAVDSAQWAVNGRAARQALLEAVRSPALKTHGEELGKFLLAGNVGTQWRKLANEVQQRVQVWAANTRDAEAAKQLLHDQPGLRPYLDIRDDALQHLPWELARCPDMLFLKQHTPFVRYWGGNHARQPKEPDCEIRLLVVLAARELDKIKTMDEVRSIGREI